ncbi:ABC transporter [Actinobaculum suis]|uniref:metal ABC transporter ATP-binding protein n=1 Tax=Actinobaculum suis TaxID=1657 RepID=UPI0008087EB2|nr:metal ABC transporter ATP-binding protein [Actinobaculum suis]OCA95757.1 ABC transporter [Actinobaculum suis]
MKEKALEVRDVRASYGRVQALTGVSFELEAGKICGLVGMNGSGKSTLMKSIMGAVRHSGQVRIFGRPAPEARKASLVGYVPQNEGVDWMFPVSVKDVVTMGRYGYMGPLRRTRPEDAAAVAEALQIVEMSEFADRQIGSLSGGQRKRVFIARVIAQGARLLLLDEPFAGVDKPSELMITRILHELVQDGRAVFVATHDLYELPNLCHEALLLYRRVIFHGDVAEALLPENLGPAFGMTPSETTAWRKGTAQGLASLQASGARAETATASATSAASATDARQAIATAEPTGTAQTTGTARESK